jgi:hypothetical protein
MGVTQNPDRTTSLGESRLTLVLCAEQRDNSGQSRQQREQRDTTNRGNGRGENHDTEQCNHHASPAGIVI